MTKQQLLREAIRKMIKKELAEAWEPEVADPDVDTDTEIIPNEDEDDLTFSPDSVPKVNPKAEREMLAKIVNRFKSIKSTNEGRDNIAMGEKPFSNFSEADQLLKSISGRLITASQMQDWNLVDEVAIDVFNFIKNR
jgi:hypothetical protein